MDIEFDLPPPNRNATNRLLIGMRISRPDANSGTQLADRLIMAEIQSQVRLRRLDGGRDERIPLFRMSQDRTQQLPVPDSGEIPVLTKSDVEPTALEAVGLSRPGEYYVVLMFATAERMVPGRYRLNVALNSEQKEFEGESIDLLVGYLRKAK